MRALMWFRADLRVADNTALEAACRGASRGPAGGVVGVFACCPTQWRQHDWGPMRVDLLLRCVEALRVELEALGIPLLFVRAERFAELPTALLALARRHGCGALFFNREYEWNEARRDEAVADAFAAASLESHAFHDQVLLPPGSVQTRQGGPYTVFSPYKRTWLRSLMSRGLPRPLPGPRPQVGLDIPSDPVPVRLPEFTGAARPDLWPAGEQEAQQRLRRFARARLTDYATQRNLPGTHGTSTVSPYLTHGVLSPRQCLEAALRGGGLPDEGSDAAVWVSELVWREFYKHLLVSHPRLSKGRCFRRRYETLPWRDDPAGLAAWSEGRTGYPLVDAGMRQLRRAGWMHNRVRMITACFLSKHLLIDWRAGERVFMNHLVDGDLAANNGGWQWASSTGTDAQPYFRVFNPWSQSKRYDPEASYIKRFLPELQDVPAAALHDPIRLARARARLDLDYPEPIVEHAFARKRAIATFKELRPVGAR